MARAIYVELNALCLLILLAIAYQSSHNVNQQMNRVLFRHMVYGIGAALILDTIWVLIEGRVFPGATALNRVVNALYLSCGVVLGCVWYLYVLETLGYTITRRLQCLVMMPGIAFTALNIASIWTGWTFTVSDANVYAHGPLFWLQMIGAYGMLLLSLGHIIVRLIDRDDRVPRRNVLKLLGFYIIPVIGALVSLPFTGMPGVWTCASVSIVLIYIDDQDSEILRDSLTGLNNRKTLDSAFSDYIRQAGPDNALYIFMIDLNHFKQINDTLGHPVGDEALVSTARILTGAMRDRRGIIARFGGDEFLMMSFFANDGEAARFAQALRDGFEEFNRVHDLPYTLDASIGFQRYARGMSLEEMIRQADANLYEDKRRSRAGHASDI